MLKAFPVNMTIYELMRKKNNLSWEDKGDVSIGSQLIFTCAVALNAGVV